MLPILLLALTGCEYGLTLPSEVARHEGPLTPSLRLAPRERRPLLPGMNSELPPPDPAIVASQCKDLVDGGPVEGPDCISGVISCGETLIGHTVGGVDRFNTRFYEKKFCTPATTDHDLGNERVYRLTMPDGDHTAWVTLDTPCADLDLAAIRWDDETCPTIGQHVHQCEMWPRPRKERERVRLVSQRETSWLLVVEGKGTEDGAFALTVQCRPGLQ